MRGRQFWRLNGQGQLWRPVWWPKDLAPVFWPLLLVAALALFGGALVWLAPRLQPLAPEPPREQISQLAPLSEDRPPEAELAEPPEPTAPTERPEPTQPPELTQPLGDSDSAPLEDRDSDPAVDQPELPPLEPDPLLVLIQRPEADGLLLGAEAEPEQGLLVLQVRPAFPALSPDEQRRRAEQWQQWASDLGYEHLELRDSHSGLVARDALVGEGMIVLRDRS
ncbi:MAG: hypothetical protein ACO23M_05255 [Vulcanococcus sp.]